MARLMRRSLAMELFPSSRCPSGLQQQIRKMATDRSTAAAASAATVEAEVSASKQLSGSSIKGTLGKRFYKNALVKPVAGAGHQQQQQSQPLPDGSFEI